MDLRNTRDDFPLLQQLNEGKPLIYLDNASMSLKPRQVIEAMTEYYENCPVAAGRGAYRLAKEVTSKCEGVRQQVQRFVRAERPEEIVFTKNTTESINVIAHCLELKAGDIVLTTDKEHNSNLVPWQELSKLKGIKHEIVRSNDDNTFNIENLKGMISRKVKLLSMCHCSNLDGYTIPAREIIEVAHDFGALVMMDGAQSATHMTLDMRKLDVDFYAFSLHKMLGPTGMGMLFGKYDHLKRLTPPFLGGSTIEDTTYDSSVLLNPPKKFEGGLQNYAGIIGSGKALEYLERISMEDIKHNNYKLNKFATERLVGLPGISLIGPRDPSLRAGIVNFSIDGFAPDAVASELDRRGNVMVRSGRHCVDSWFNAKGIRNSLRASTYFYNTLEEIKQFVETFEEIVGDGAVH